MNVSAYHIQNVIRSYSQRMGRRDPFAQKKSDSGPMSDTISISDDAKKAQLTARLGEMLSKDTPSFIKGYSKDEMEFAKRLMEKLGTGNRYQIESLPYKNQQQTGFRFKIVNTANEETIKELSMEDVKTMIGSIQNNT